MSIEFWTSIELNLVVAKWTEEITLHGFKENFARYLNDVHYRPGRPEFVDLTEVTKIDLGFKSIWAGVTMVNDQVPGQKVRTPTTIVAPGDIVYGLVRTYQMLAQNADGIRVEVYRDAKTALDALELPFGSTDALLNCGCFFPREQAASVS